MPVARIRAVILPAAALLLAACGTTAQRDVEASAWPMSAEPQVVLGTDGAPEARLTGVVAVLPMPGGELVVVDRSDAPIKVFGIGGEFRRVIGTRGAQEGQFGLLNWAALTGDTLLVYDIGHRRAVWLRNDGEVLGAAQPQGEGYEGTVTPVALLSSGEWLVTAGAPAPRVTVAPGVLQDTLYFGTLPAGRGGRLNILHRSLTPRIAQVPSTERFVPGFYFALPLALPVGGQIVVADPGEATLTIYATPAGEGTRVDLPMPRQRTTRAELDRQREMALAGADERSRPGIEARFSPAAMPELVPAFRRVLADGDDALWLEAWSPDPAAPARYEVVGLDGTWRAAVVMPPGFTPLTIGTDWVLGVHRNPEGLERVVQFGLTRAPAIPAGTALASGPVTTP